MQIAGTDLEDLELVNIGNWPKGLRSLLIFAAGILILTLCYTFYLKDHCHEYESLLHQRLELQTSFEKAYEQASNLEEYKKQVSTVEQSLEILTAQLPKTSEAAGLLDDITRQALSSGLTFLSFKPLPEKHLGFYIEHPIGLVLQGSYHNFGEFVSNIAAMSRIVTLHDFTLKAISDNPRCLDIHVIVKTYWSIPTGFQVATRRR